MIPASRTLESPATPTDDHFVTTSLFPHQMESSTRSPSTLPRSDCDGIVPATAFSVKTLWAEYERETARRNTFLDMISQAEKMMSTARDGVLQGEKLIKESGKLMGDAARKSLDARVKFRRADTRISELLKAIEDGSGEKQ